MNCVSNWRTVLMLRPVIHGMLVLLPHVNEKKRLYHFVTSIAWLPILLVCHLCRSTAFLNHNLDFILVWFNHWRAILGFQAVIYPNVTYDITLKWLPGSLPALIQPEFLKGWYIDLIVSFRLLLIMTNVAWTRRINSFINITWAKMWDPAY